MVLQMRKPEYNPTMGKRGCKIKKKYKHNERGEK